MLKIWLLASASHKDTKELYLSSISSLSSVIIILDYKYADLVKQACIIIFEGYNNYNSFQRTSQLWKEVGIPDPLSQNNNSNLELVPTTI